MAEPALSNISPIRPDLQVVEQRVADTDDGYTRLANELYEELIGADLTKNQAKVAHAVCRKTYGFNKKTDRIADSQLSELTNLPRQKVNKAKNDLLAMKVLMMDGNKIGPNKNLNEWQIKGCHHNSVSVTKTVTKSVTKTVTAVSPKQGHTKDNITKDKKENNSTSENSDESSDTDCKNQIVFREGAAVQTTNGNKWGTDDDLKTAEWIFARVRKVSPTAKQPTWASWANDIRLLRDALEISHQEICRVFNWANKDQFWQTNILSPSKLRKQWDTLSAKMLQQPNHSSSHSVAKPEPHWNSKESWEDVI